MNDGWLVVLQKTSAMFLVMIAGWLAARRGLWKPEAGLTLSRFLVDLVYPCYVIVQFIRTVDTATLRGSWIVPVLGFLVVLVGALVGLLAGPAIRNPVRRRTAIFLVAITNWIYLPLPIAEGLFGAEGVRTILLMNVGAQAAIWTVGVGILNPGLSFRDSARHVLVNPGIIATAIGLVLAVFLPSLGSGTGWAAAFQPVLAAADLLGSLTIPLSLLIVGAQLGEKPISTLKPEPALGLVLLLRLVAAPAAALGLVHVAATLGLVIPEVPRLCFLLVAAMPAALSCTLFTERYNGDSLLSSKVIFASTLASLVTVPAFFKLISFLGG